MVKILTRLPLIASTRPWEWMVRNEVAAQWISTNRFYRENEAKEVYYFSMEFLLGRLLENNLLNLGALNLCREGLSELGISLG